MNCEKEKIIMMFYGELDKCEEKKILEHINVCIECRNFYNVLTVLSKLNEVDFSYLIKEEVKQEIFSCASGNIKRIVDYFRFIFYPVLLSLSIVLLFAGTKENIEKNFISSFKNNITEIEKSLDRLSYDTKFFNDDLNF